MDGINKAILFIIFLIAGFVVYNYLNRPSSPTDMFDQCFDACVNVYSNPNEQVPVSAILAKTCAGRCLQTLPTPSEWSSIVRVNSGDLQIQYTCEAIPFPNNKNINDNLYASSCAESSRDDGPIKQLYPPTNYIHTYLAKLIPVRVLPLKPEFK